MKGLKLKNNAGSSLAASMSATETMVRVLAGHGVRFPSLAVGDWFPLAVQDVQGCRKRFPAFHMITSKKNRPEAVIGYYIAPPYDLITVIFPVLKFSFRISVSNTPVSNNAS